VVAQLAPDFELLDAWQLPARGGPEEFAALLEVMASLDPARGKSSATHALFWLRHRLGELFGWDDPSASLPLPGCAETTLSARLPDDLRGSASTLSLRASGFTPLFRTRDEWAAELSNRTVHAILQLTWIDEGAELHNGRMAVYVKPRGRLGELYLRLIRPFRQHIVYPALMRDIGRAWQVRGDRARLE
jgi:hypothetical protein